MPKELEPYDSEQYDDARRAGRQSGDRHYHYHDHRTVIADCPADDDTDEGEEGAAPPILARWQKLTLLLLVALAFIFFFGPLIFSAAPTTTNTVTTVDTTSDPQGESANPVGIPKGATAAASPASEATAITLEPEADEKRWLARPSFAAFNFDDYPATRYQGPIVPPSFSATQRPYAAYRTRLSEAANAGPNFAGNIAVAGVGCGAGCVSYYFINVQTGSIVDHTPTGAGDADQVEYDQLIYRSGSNLMFEVYQIVDEATDATRCVYNVYKWDGQRLQSLASDTASLAADNPVCP